MNVFRQWKGKKINSNDKVIETLCKELDSQKEIILKLKTKIDALQLKYEEKQEESVYVFSHDKLSVVDDKGKWKNVPELRPSERGFSILKVKLQRLETESETIESIFETIRARKEVFENKEYFLKIDFQDSETTFWDEYCSDEFIAKRS